MLAAYIIVIACTLIMFSFVTRSLQGKAARLHFSQSMLPPLETGIYARNQVENILYSGLELVM